MVRFACFLMLVLIACQSEKDIMMETFLSLHQEVKIGNFEEYDKYLDAASQKMVTELSDPRNMSSEQLRNLGEQYELPFWAAEYYRSYSKTILKMPERNNFFKYLSDTKVPLFDYYENYYLVEDKSRIKKDRNFIVIGRDFGKYRYVEFLEYNYEEGAYKLDLIKLIQLQNTLLARSIHETWKYEDDPIPVDWKEQSIDEIYNSILRDPKPERKSYNKNNRSEHQVEEQ